jgi:galactokinase
MISESSKEQDIYYECLSEEILKMYKRIEKINPEICVKLASEGWSGNIFTLGKINELNKLGETILEFYDSAFENKGVEGLNANLWISDEVYKYCYWSDIGGSMAFLNPVYEDFMLLDLK